MPNIRANFLYYLTAAMAIFGIAALSVPLFASFSPAAGAGPEAAIEFDLTSLAEGEHVRLNIFGKPVFIRHRRPQDIEAVRKSYQNLIYPERDEDRLLTYKGQKDPRYIIVEGNVPWCFAVANSGDFANQGGWFCSRGSHFDGSGRILKGPDRNMRVPRNARFSSMTTVQFFKDPIPKLPD